MANKKCVRRMLVKALTFGLAASAALILAGCLSLNMYKLFLGEEDTSVNWQMSAIYRYADRAHAAANTWYKFTAEEKPGETYYAYKQRTEMPERSDWSKKYQEGVSAVEE